MRIWTFHYLPLLHALVKASPSATSSRVPSFKRVVFLIEHLVLCSILYPRHWPSGSERFRSDLRSPTFQVWHEIRWYDAQADSGGEVPWCSRRRNIEGTVLLHCTALHCTALHCTALHCTALHCTALHCTVLYCTIGSSMGEVYLQQNSADFAFVLSKQLTTSRETLVPSVMNWYDLLVRG